MVPGVASHSENSLRRLECDDDDDDDDDDRASTCQRKTVSVYAVS
jgi:hypothetical protein